MRERFMPIIQESTEKTQRNAKYKSRIIQTFRNRKRALKRRESEHWATRLHFNAYIHILTYTFISMPIKMCQKMCLYPLGSVSLSRKHYHRIQSKPVWYSSYTLLVLCLYRVRLGSVHCSSCHRFVIVYFAQIQTQIVWDVFPATTATMED